MTVLLLAASLGAPLAAGLLATAGAAPRLGVGLRLALGLGLGLGLASLFFFLFLVLYGAASRVLILAEILVMAVALVASRRGWEDALRPGAAPVPAGRFVQGVFLTVALLAGAAFVLRTLNHPLGGWDAWAFWNMRARFLFLGGEGWARGFADVLGWSSTAYPLLVPATTARVWTYLGADAPAGPALGAFAFTAATVALLVTAVAHLRGRTAGYVGGLLLLATAYFVRHGAAQYADVPLGFFFLAALALVVLADESAESPAAVLGLAGLAAGLAAWTKNEGLLFLGALVLARLVVALADPAGRAQFGKTARAFALGAVPVLLVLAVFKMTYGTTSGFVAALGLEAAARLTEEGRAVRVGQGFLRTLLRHDGLVALLVPVYAGLAGLDLRALRRPGVRTAALTLALMLAGYFAAFLLTPADLAWHLDVALKRLLLQLWPSVLFVAMLLIRRPEAP